MIKTTQATYFEVEPGDATRYIGFYTFMPDGNLQLCFGTEGRGGTYVVPKDNLYYEFKKFAQDVADGVPPHLAAKEMYMPGYWSSHSGVTDRWTGIAAVLFAVVVYWGNPVEDYPLIGHVYHSEDGSVQEYLDALMRHEDFTPA